MVDTPAEIEELVAISRYAGSSADFVQGGGGNTSVKSDCGKLLHIKASGFRLADVNSTGGYLSLNLPRLLEIVGDSSYSALSHREQQDRSAREMQSAVLVAGALRPSLETGFHAVLDRVVIHTHAVPFNVGTCLVDGQNQLMPLLEKLDHAVWINYAPPGHPLAIEIARTVKRYEAVECCRPRILALQNHGLVIASNSAGEAIELHEAVVKTTEAVFGSLDFEARALRDTDELDQIAGTVAETLQLQTVTARGEIFRLAAAQPEIYLNAGPLFPDDVVFCGLAPLVAHPNEDILTLLERRRGTKKLVLIFPARGVMFAGTSAASLKAMEESLVAHLKVRFLAAKLGPLKTLSAADALFIANMEGEAYREKLIANL